MKYIWQNHDWPKFTWDSDALLPVLGQARRRQGDFLGSVRRLGMDLGLEAQADVLAEETIKTSAIEGERLDPQMVRSSVARHLGLKEASLGPVMRAVDGLVEVIMDATQNYNKPLTATRLKSWQAALFPTGYSGLHKIKAGEWRGDEPMRVVSGPVGREKIHFEAPPGNIMDREMRGFLSWWSSSSGKMDGLLRAGIAHFYFVTIHPFEDGNGRVARALTDMALAQDEALKARYYSLSAQIMEEREGYYDILERSSRRRDTDVTEWLVWFLGTFMRAINRSDRIVRKVLVKADFWLEHGQDDLNPRQKKVINRILEAGEGNFEGGLTTRKYASITNTSRATSFREISDLLEKNILRQLQGKGRNVSYDLVWPKGPEGTNTHN